MLIGTPTNMAIKDVTIVPRRYGSAPNTSLPGDGFHWTPIRKFQPNLLKTGRAPWTRMAIVSPRITMIDEAKTESMIRKISSEVVRLNFSNGLVAVRFFVMVDRAVEV
jgi:hypothetical protein